MDERNDEFFRPLMSCELFGQTRIKWTSYGFIPQQGQTIGLAPNFFSNVDMKFRFRNLKKKSYFITEKTKRIPICKIVKKGPQ